MSLTTLAAILTTLQIRMDLSDEQFSTKIEELQTFKCPFIESELQNAK